MDPVPVGFVIFLVSPAGNSEGVGDEQASEGGLGVVGEVVPGEDSV
jgi:hypothetical protein